MASGLSGATAVTTEATGIDSREETVLLCLQTGNEDEKHRV